MSELLFAAYLIAPVSRGNPQLMFSSQNLNNQEQKIQAYLQANPNRVLTKSFVEIGDNKRQRHRWPELKKAIEYCIQNKTNLIIAEIRNLTNNESFTDLILTMIQPKDPNAFIPDIHCCDQPFITRHNFPAIVEHASEQRKIHGELIKAGLSRTSAKSGNPHASEVITKVNKPKIDNAIIYALLLQPIVYTYQTKGYSQRRMVTALNEEGILAPEGGKWVLSQLQKVLDRIKINDTALALEKAFKQYEMKGLNIEQIAAVLNSENIPAPKGKIWTAEMADAIHKRIKQIHDILKFNELVIELSPVLNKYHVDEMNEEVLLEELKHIGVKIPPTMLNNGTSAHT